MSSGFFMQTKGVIMKKLIFTMMLLMAMFAVTIPAAVLPPSDFTISNPTTTSLDLSWTNNHAVFDSTSIYASEDSAWVTSVDDSQISVTISDLSVATEYLYFARTDSAGTESVDSNEDTLSTAYPQIKRLSGLNKVQNARSWGITAIIDTFLVYETSVDDSSNVVVLEPIMWWQGYAAGTTVEVVARFYSGVCNGPFAVTLQDTLTLVEGLNEKRIYWGGTHGYILFAGVGSNGTDTVISDSFWMSWTPKR